MNDKTSAFNPGQFMQTTVNEANSTEIVLVPEGDYTAVTAPINEDSFKSFDIKEGNRAGEKFYRMDVKWNINDDGGQLRELLGRDPSVTQGIGLDFTKEGALEMGKGRNVALGQLREALGQNVSGKPWSPIMLGGQVAQAVGVHDYGYALRQRLRHLRTLRFTESGADHPGLNASGRRHHLGPLGPYRVGGSAGVSHHTGTAADGAADREHGGTRVLAGAGQHTNDAAPILVGVSSRDR